MPPRGKMLCGGRLYSCATRLRRLFTGWRNNSAPEEVKRWMRGGLSSAGASIPSLRISPWGKCKDEVHTVIPAQETRDSRASKLVELANARVLAAARIGADEQLAAALERALQRLIKAETPERSMVLIPILACEWAGGEPEAALSAAAAWRSLHLASKCIDDVVDGDALRVGGLAGLARVADIGLAMYSTSTLCLEDMPRAARDETAQCIHRTVKRMLSGQYREHTAGEGDTVEECLHTIGEKAGAFFELGVMMGIRSSGSRCGGEGTARAAGYAAGVFRQLSDDLLGLRQEGPAGDVANGRRKLPMAYALSVASQEEADQLRALMELVSTAPSAEADVRNLMWKLGAEAYMQFQMALHRERTLTCMRDAGGDPKLAQDLGEALLG